jgi:CDP-alcohol phosphatidyltransferase-like enzyme
VAARPPRLAAFRAPVNRPPESTRFVDDILAELASRQFGPSAWMRFFGRSLARSAAQARIRPAAAVEVTAIHLVAAAGSVRWALASWLLCITHLGLLGDRRTLGWPDRLTLVRALLPALGPDSRWTAPLSLATDFLDGRLARRGGGSAFGAFADPIADGVFWSWYALRWDPSPWLRWVPITLFGGSVAVIAGAYFARGRTIDYPRPMAIRYASGIMQIVLTLRSVRRRPGSP